MRYGFWEDNGGLIITAVGLLLVAVIGWVASSFGTSSNQDALRALNEQRLPAGCKIIDMDYGSLRTVVVCDGRKTTTSVGSISNRTQTNVVID